MSKERRDLLHVSTKVFKLIVLIGAAVATITVALTFFARSKTVQMLDQRLGLNISQDIVNSKKSDVRWMKQQAAFENRKEPPTFAEQEMITAAEHELAEQKRLHGERVEHFEEKYQQQF